jgi:nitrogen fixation protein NifB
VNQHLGEADRLFIFRVGGDGTVVAQSARALPPPGGGDARWAELVRTISDCNAVFASGLGAAPRRALEAAGISVHVVEGLAAEALKAAAAGRSLDFLAPRAECGSGCAGSGRGGCGCS